MTRFLVSSANGTNGDGFGTILGFTAEGSPTGPFSRDRRITDPRGLSLDPIGDLVYVNSGDNRTLALDRHGSVVLDSGRIDRLDPGGGTFGRDGRYYVGLRQRRTIRAFSPGLDTVGEDVLAERVVPFPRGFGFGAEGRLYLASGVGPSGKGVAVFDRGGVLRNARLVSDTELSPLDLSTAPNGNIVVSSEFPFALPDAEVTIREYDPSTGRLIRIFTPNEAIGFSKPRGLRFGSDDHLYCVGRDHVVVFDFSTGRFLDVAVSLSRLNGQAIVILP
jgi:hypothetical protein